jgi:hypothetical protein
VQAYAALAFSRSRCFCFLFCRRAAAQATSPGIFLLGAGVSIYITELWRDPEGRGSFFGGALDGPQLAAVVFVFIGAAVLLEHKQAKQSIEAVHG